MGRNIKENAKQFIYGLAEGIGKGLEKSVTRSSGMGFCGILTLLFVVAKLFHVIEWSWWWVFSPLWIPWAAVLGFFSVLFLIAILIMIVAMVDEWWGGYRAERRKRVEAAEKIDADSK